MVTLYVSGASTTVTASGECVSGIRKRYTDRGYMPGNVYIMEV